ncbi:MAG: glycoside hydrolase family 95 protein, partial [Clostridia bacterium]|nr:glycoside hydrolase family 95 protein [Clostridia bacterium]
VTLSDGIRVENADGAKVIFSCATNYRLTHEVFDEPEHQNKLKGLTVDKEAVVSAVEKALAMPYGELKERHVSDYRSLYARVTLDIGGGEGGNTDKLIEEHRSGKRSLYLETLLFQYGRYLLISSSRTRLPAHLQGIWNAYSDSPWSCGYWHNINVQMNYWPSGPANLSDTFIPYINYAKAYMPSARRHADRYIKDQYPMNYTEDGTNGWIIGTGAWAYSISGFSGGGHSGPGTGAFTSLLFWDYYDYTRDTAFLREFGYPALYEMSVFFSKALVEIDGKYLIKESASPENVHEGKHYQTVGCAFDQQMVYENFKRTVESAEILGISDPFIDRINDMLPHLDPVLIGDDGQVKEYREETTYSSIGDPHHRHISHLVGLYPATVINSETTEWLEGAKVTLTNRGDRSTCWAVAHRLLLWARTKTPKKCRDLIDSFIERNVLPNLWCYHPPFQIDGNFGYTAGVCEMLMQSQSGYIELLPSIPEEWSSGQFTGLVARGNMSVDCAWENGTVKTVKVTARADGELKIKLPAHLLPQGANAENGIYCACVRNGEALHFGEKTDI